MQRDGKSLAQPKKSRCSPKGTIPVEKNAAVARPTTVLQAADGGRWLATSDEFHAGMRKRAVTALQRIRVEVSKGGRTERKLRNTCSVVTTKTSHAAAGNLKHQPVLTVAYGAGSRATGSSPVAVHSPGPNR